MWALAVSGGRPGAEGRQLGGDALHRRQAGRGGRVGGQHAGQGGGGGPARQGVLVVDVVAEPAVRVVVGEQADRDQGRGGAGWVPLEVEAGQQRQQEGGGLLREPAEEVRGPGADLRVLVGEQFEQDGKLGADRVIGAQGALAGVDGMPGRAVRPYSRRFFSRSSSVSMAIASSYSRRHSSGLTAAARHAVMLMPSGSS